MRYLRRKQRQDPRAAADIQHNFAAYERRVLLYGLLVGASADCIFEHLLVYAYRHIKARRLL